MPDKVAAFTEPAASNTDVNSKVFAKKRGFNKVARIIVILSMNIRHSTPNHLNE